MVNRKFTLILAMLVLAIFAVGSVSAADNVTDDIVVPTEDIAIDDVPVEDVNENDNVIDEGGNRPITYDVYDTYTSAQINSVINGAATTTHQVSFSPGTYNNTVLTLVSNVNLIGNGAKLVGDGVNTVIAVDNCKNFTITGFEIDGNYVSSAHNISAIRGSDVRNGTINNNIIYNAYNGININKKYYNMTIEDNMISNMINDGISLAHPNSNSNINDPEYTCISGNNLTNCTFGIFIGGNFKGVISNNTITVCTHGIQSLGKKDGAISNIIANISGNNIEDVETGIEFINMTAISLNINDNTITTNDYYLNFTIDYGGYFSNSTNCSIRVYNNTLDGAIKESFINMTCIFSNDDDGYIRYGE